jgi:phosphoribosylformylglycinamidine synthase subunit PurSL
VDGHLPGAFGERHKISGLPTMQFTATSVVPDVLNCPTMESKIAGDLVFLLGVTRNELGGSEYYDFFGCTGLNVPKLDPKSTLPIYLALEQAVATGLVASCHGIYRGGLAIHAALMTFGSNLGLTLDLTKVRRSGALSPDQLLFSESCGRFLITVSPSRQQAFQKLFQNLPCALVGEVVADQRLVILGSAGKTLIAEPVAALKQSWKQMEH